MNNKILIIIAILLALCTGIIAGILYQNSTADYTMSDAQARAYCGITP